MKDSEEILTRKNFDGNEEEIIVFENIRFQESILIQVSYISMYLIGGVIFIFSIIWLLSDFSVGTTLASLHPMLLTIRVFDLLYYAIILALTLKFFHYSKWNKWNKPMYISKDITKSIVLLSSVSLLITRVGAFIFYNIVERKGQAYSDLVYAGIYTTAVFIASLILYTILEFIEKREIREVDFRPTLLMITIALFYIYSLLFPLLFYTFTTLNMRFFVDYAIISVIYFLNGTIFLLMSRNEKRRKNNILHLYNKEL